MDESHVNRYTRKGLVKNFAVWNQLSRYVIDMFISMNEDYARGRLVLSDVENGVDEMVDLSAVGQDLANTEA